MRTIRPNTVRPFCGNRLFSSLMMLWTTLASHAAEMTFAERLGWKPGSVVVILHVDDVGMSRPSNLGAVEAVPLPSGSPRRGQRTPPDADF
jgi:hypothetical protein